LQNITTHIYIIKRRQRYSCQTQRKTTDALNTA